MDFPLLQDDTLGILAYSIICLLIAAGILAIERFANWCFGATWEYGADKSDSDH